MKHLFKIMVRRQKSAQSMGSLMLVASLLVIVGCQNASHSSVPRQQPVNGVQPTGTPGGGNGAPPIFSQGQPSGPQPVAGLGGIPVSNVTPTPAAPAAPGPFVIEEGSAPIIVGAPNLGATYAPPATGATAGGTAGTGQNGGTSNEAVIDVGGARSTQFQLVGGTPDRGVVTARDSGQAPSILADCGDCPRPNLQERSAVEPAPQPYQAPVPETYEAPAPAPAAPTMQEPAPAPASVQGFDVALIINALNFTTEYGSGTRDAIANTIADFMPLWLSSSGSDVHMAVIPAQKRKAADIQVGQPISSGAGDDAILSANSLKGDELREHLIGKVRAMQSDKAPMTQGFTGLKEFYEAFKTSHYSYSGLASDGTQQLFRPNAAWLVILVSDENDACYKYKPVELNRWQCLPKSIEDAVIMPNCCVERTKKTKLKTAPRASH